MTPSTIPPLSSTPAPLLTLTTIIYCFIAIQVYPSSAAAGGAAAANCPSKCTCSPDTNNTDVDCTGTQLTAPPRTLSLDTVKLSLSHNALGPIINESLPRMAKLVGLDLSYNGITRLLVCTLQGLLGLRRLSMRGNRLTSLPDSLFTDADGVEHLDIGHNILTAVPDHVFRNLPNLKTLDASHNRMVRLEFGLALQVPRHLLSIDLSNNHFETIAEDSFQVATGWEPGLKRTLNLANCRLTTIQTPALSKIPGLNDIDLSGNPGIPLDNLTSAVKELETTGLEKLSISSLNLTTIESLFTHVTTMSLKFLNVSDNGIRTVPANTFSTISSLRVFDISNNELSELGDGFSDLRNLRRLVVSFNSLTSFKGDDVVPRLSKLKYLDMSNNELSDPVDVNLNPLTDLKHLDASVNHLTSAVLPETTNHLVHCDFHSNAITQFSGFDNAPKLKFFDMSDNDLTEVKEYLFKESKPTLVNFSRNSITKLNTNAFRHHSPLVIDLSHNFIEKILYSYWLNAQELYLNDNNIRDLDFKSFQLMNGLRVLDLSQNQLPSLHDDLLDYTTALTHLNLSHNSIRQTNFPLLFRNLESLEVLDMSNNNVSHLNESMLAPIPKLKRFLLARNHLEIVKPRVFRDLTHIRNIDLSGNPFICSCDNLGFQDWLTRTKIDITGLYAVNSSGYVCRAPANRVGQHVTEWNPDQFECDRTMLYMIICGSVGLTLIVAGVISTILYRVYKCHKRRKLEKEKEKFRRKCYRDDYDDDDDDDNYDDDDDDVEDGYHKKKGGKLDLSKMSTEEIAEEITNAIERRERRSMRKAEEMNKKKNSNGYVSWPPNGNVKPGEHDTKMDQEKSRSKKSSSNNNGNHNNLSNGRRESIEARQYDRIIQQQLQQQQERDAKLLRHSAAETSGGKRGGGGAGGGGGDIRDTKEHRRSKERYVTQRIDGDDDDVDESGKHRPQQNMVVRTFPLSQQQQQQQPSRWKQSPYHPYLQPEPEPDYGYETEPAPRSSSRRRRDDKRDRYNDRWESMDVWDRERRGWLIQHPAQGQQRQHRPHQRSRSQEPAGGSRHHRYLTLPIREGDHHHHPIGHHERGRSSRRDNPRLYLDPYTNEVRFGVDDLPPRHHSSNRKLQQQQPPPPPHHHRQSRWDAYHQQQRQQQYYKLRSRSLHHLPHQDYDDNNDDIVDNERRYHQQQHPQHHHRSNRRSGGGDNDDRRPLIGQTRAISQPYLVNENTSDWL